MCVSGRPIFTHFHICLFIRIYPFLRKSVHHRRANCKSMLLWKGFTVSCIQCGVFNLCVVSFSVYFCHSSDSLFQAENACLLGFLITVVFNIITSSCFALVASFLWGCANLSSSSYTHVLQMHFPTCLKVDGIQLQFMLSVCMGLINN